MGISFNITDLKYEGLVDVKAQGDDVLGVLHGQTFGIVHFEAFPQILFIVSQLDHQRDVERLLQPSETQQIFSSKGNKGCKIMLTL